MKHYYFIIFLLMLLILLIIQRILRLYRGNLIYWKKNNVEDNETNVVIFNSYNESYTNKKFVEMNKLILKKYSERHNHVYKCLVHPDNFMSPYWLRVFDLNNICNSTPDDTLIAYFDADAVPLVDDVSISSFIKSVDLLYKNNGKDIYISEDPLKEWDILYPGIFNTGCFILRNTLKSRNFVKEWLGKYNKDFVWTQKNNKWKCEIKNRECIWSHDGYEQGEFTNLYKNNMDIIQYLHWSTLACQDTNNKHCFVLHLMGDTEKTREKIFKEQLAKY